MTAEVEDDKEEVERNHADDRVRLGNRSGFLEIVQGGVFRELMIQFSDKRRRSVRVSESRVPRTKPTHLFVKL